MTNKQKTESHKEEKPLYETGAYCYQEQLRNAEITSKQGSFMDKATVAKVSRLARIRLTDAEQDKFTSELDHIMQWIEQLSTVDTDNVEPLPSPVNIDLRLRDDEINDGDCAKDVLANAPEENTGFYVVPKVVE